MAYKQDSEKIITLENATKIYAGNTVLDGISLSFVRGESVAFIGHNGCGKSTMLKVLAGLISLSGGAVNYHQKLRFSYVPEKFPGMEIEMLDYLNGIAAMEGVDSGEVMHLINDFFLESMIHTRLDKLSKGSLQKVGVIQAIIKKHDVLLLDEPLSGQDTDSQEVFIAKINELRKQGVTVFMSCHEQRLVDELSDKVYMIDRGKLVEASADVANDRPKVVGGSEV
ncbi:MULTISPECIES: ATP-binding cassette domain-containing protein [unclassified Butyrivibrio]|uniref:ATP-binding cassette domain-containing protein n=1 Tax=unclassified Butyrivibrio TaxID=2639466 RepID=UPI0004238BF7|nr:MULTISPECIES: ATP-binding cassette domain-containing protein [unclassified Butyrivibrio]SEM31440.1 ABC-type multidrug transport system, ATPase component [Butyrivibrio sp. ob235]